MCEFTGLDFEMEINEHYFEVLDVVGKLFASIFQGLQDSLGAALPCIAGVCVSVWAAWTTAKLCRPAAA